MGIPIADAPNIEIIYGQAGSGKTEEAVRRYAECVSDHGEDAALLIVPTARVVRQVRERLVDEGRPPGLVDPRIFTFPQLAQIILNANHECATPIGGAMQRLLIGEVIDSLIADGELVELADVARLPGFAVALMELVSDLKRGAVEPRPFCHALAQAGLNETWRGEISKLYCAYQWMLICLRYFDDEGVFWWARGVLRDGGRRPLEQTRLMVVDGFTDFTTTQLQMLQLLAEGIPRTVVTLDYAEHDEREGLAQWFGDTVERVRDHLPGAAIHPLPGGIAPNALGHLRGTVFSPPGKVEPVPADGRVHVLDCPTRFREVREVLRRVKGLLVEGQASPGEIAIICRSVSGRADAIRSTAARMGVPVYVEAARSPATNPAVRAVLQAYEVVAGGYRRADVVDLLRSSYLTLEPLLARHLTADDVACVAAEALVLEGRRQWAERLSALEARLREREEYRASIDDDGMPRPSGTAAALVAEVSASVAALFDILPAHGTGLTRLERVAETRELIAVTRLREGLERPEMRRRASEDIRAIEQLGSALDALEHAREARGPSGGLPPGEYLALLREVLEDLADTPPPPSGERVAVLDARRARQLRFKHCFVMGLNEGEFPRRRRDEPFFSGDDLRALERAGVDLNRRRTPEGEEPVLLYGAIGAATEHLWLSFAATDASGKALQRSHYVAEILACLDETTLDRHSVPLSSVMPELDDVADAHELLDRAFSDLSEFDPTPIGYNLLTRLPTARDRVCAAAHGARVLGWREPRAAAGIFVGLMDDAGIVDELASGFGALHRFSGTQLGSYAGCPFAFYCQNVLRLDEPDEPSPQAEPRDDGNVRHRILRRFIDERKSARPDGPAVMDGEQQEAERQIADIVDREYSFYADRRGVPDPALWDVERRRARAEFRKWIEVEVSAFGCEVPVECEYVFGRTADSPVTLLGRGDILIEGTIDRINAVGEGRFSLVDYKRGAGPSWATVESAVDPQLPIYTRAVTVVPPTPGLVTCAGWHYARVRGSVGVKSYGKRGNIMETADAASDIIAGYVDGIRAGSFGYLSTVTCIDYCPYSDVCRHDEWGNRGRSEDADE